MENTCNNCNKVFSTLKGLKCHSLYCSELLGRKFKCDFCSRELCSKQSFNNHVKTCKHKKEDNSDLVNNLKSENLKLKSDYEKLQSEYQLLQKLLKDKDDRINELKLNFDTSMKTLSTIANKSGNTYNQINNTLNYLQPITKDDFEKLSSNLLEDHDIINEKQFAKFCMQTGLKNKVVKTDHSRKVITYVDEEGKQIKDPKAKELTESIYKSTKTVFQEKAKQYEKFNDEQDKDRLDFYTSVVSVNKESMAKFSDAIVNEANKTVNNYQHKLFVDLKELVKKSAFWLFSQGTFGIGEWIYENLKAQINVCRSNTSIKNKYIIFRETSEKIDNKTLKEGLKYSFTIDNLDELLLEQSLTRPENKEDIKKMIEMCKKQYQILLEQQIENEWDNVIIGLCG